MKNIKKRKIICFLIVALVIILTFSIYLLKSNEDKKVSILDRMNVETDDKDVDVKTLDSKQMYYVINGNVITVGKNDDLKKYVNKNVIVAAYKQGWIDMGPTILVGTLKEIYPYEIKRRYFGEYGVVYIEEITNGQDFYTLDKKILLIGNSVNSKKTEALLNRYVEVVYDGGDSNGYVKGKLTKTKNKKDLEEVIFGDVNGLYTINGKRIIWQNGDDQYNFEKYLNKKVRAILSDDSVIEGTVRNKLEYDSDAVIKSMTIKSNLRGF